MPLGTASEGAGVDAFGELADPDALGAACEDGAVLDGAVLEDAVLEDAVLEDAVLEDAVLEDAVLEDGAAWGDCA